MCKCQGNFQYRINPEEFESVIHKCDRCGETTGWSYQRKEKEEQERKVRYQYGFECGCEITMSDYMDRNPKHCPFHGAPVARRKEIEEVE